MAEILQEMRRNWRVRGEPMGRLLTRGRPDITIEERGARMVLVENEFVPANTLERMDVLPKLGRKLHDGTKVEAIIAVKTPARFRNFEGGELRRELRAAADLEYAVHAEERFPERGWMTGGLINIAEAASTAAIPRRRVGECVDMMVGGIDRVASLLEGAGADTREKIARALYQKENAQTWRMAGLMLSNAFVFHSHIAGQRGIRTLAELTRLGAIPTQSLVEEWDGILRINYYPIFHVARKMLSSVNDAAAKEIIAVLAGTTGSINSLGLAHSTDMYGSLIQRMISDRKTLASFYTLPESAALMASLVAPPPGAGLYGSRESMQDVRVADFACGTGTLLTTVYRRLKANYEAGGGDMEAIHGKMMEGCIVGFDILPSATHLTVSALAEIFPTKLFARSRIGRIFFGKKDGECRLGSLDLIQDEATLDKRGVYVAGRSEQEYEHPDIRNGSVDLVCMNPPFTSNTREGGAEGFAMFKSFDTDARTQKEMSRASKAMFAGTCADGNAGYATNFVAIADKKLAPGGSLGLILPSTATDGASWGKCRDLFRQNYESLTVISIAGPSNKDGAFSFDTNMNEVMVIARKHGKEALRKIADAKIQIKRTDAEVGRLDRALARRTKDARKIKATKGRWLRERAELVGRLGGYGAARGTFVSLEERPRSALHALEIGRQIAGLRRPAALDGPKYAHTPVALGRQVAGSALDCPLDSGWWFVNVYDARLAQCAYRLARGALKISEWEEYGVPMTALGGGFGPLARDIADKKPGGTRAPFTIFPPEPSAAYYALSANDSGVQRSMLVEPDGMAVPKAGASRKHVREKAATATHVHLNIITDYRSQKLLVLYTDRKTLGGGALPSFNTEHGKALAVWGNSSLGVLCFWANSGKQKFGRGISSKTAMAKMPVLDFDRLGPAKLGKFDRIFDKYSAEELRPIKHLYDDPVRIAVDEAVCGALGIRGSLDDIRRRLCREPSISGGALSPGL